MNVPLPMGLLDVEQSGKLIFNTTTSTCFKYGHCVESIVRRSFAGQAAWAAGVLAAVEKRQRQQAHIPCPLHKRL